LLPLLSNAPCLRVVLVQCTRGALWQWRALDRRATVTSVVDHVVYKYYGKGYTRPQRPSAARPPCRQPGRMATTSMSCGAAARDREANRREDHCHRPAWRGHRAGPSPRPREREGAGPAQGAARAAGTRYTIFVARKQWAQVAEALAADAEDAAIIEGYTALDPRVKGIAVYATSVTTKRLQAAKRAITAAATP